MQCDNNDFNNTYTDIAIIGAGRGLLPDGTKSLHWMNDDLFSQRI